MKTPIKTFAIAAASLGLVFTSAPVLADEQDSYVPKAQLSFDDLDLSTRSGQRELDRRIDALASAMCGSDTVTTGSRIRKDSRAVRDCVKAAKASAKQQVATIVEDKQRGG